MHEAAIVEDVIRQVLQEAEKNGLAKVCKIHLAVGRLHHLVRQAMTELFDLMKCEYPVLAEAGLRIAFSPLRFVCRACGRETKEDAPSFLCPACRSSDIRIVTGNELILTRIEGEQNE